MSLVQRKLREHMIRNGELSDSIPIPVDPSVLAKSAFGATRRTTPTISNIQEPLSEKKSGPKMVMIQDLENPYIKEAVARIVVRDVEKRRVIATIFAFLIWRLVKSLFGLLVLPLPPIHFDAWFTLDLNWGVDVIQWVLYPVLIWNIISSVYRLAKPLDKCLDLPLTRQQRELVGLPQINDLNGNKLEDDGEERDEWIPKSPQQGSIENVDKPVQIRLEDLDLNDMANLNISPRSSNTNAFSYNKVI